MKLADLLFESTASVISTTQLFSPHFLLALIGANLRPATGAGGIRVAVLSC